MWYRANVSLGQYKTRRSGCFEISMARRHNEKDWRSHNVGTSIQEKLFPVHITNWPIKRTARDSEEVESENIIDQINPNFYMDHFLSSHSSIGRLPTIANTIFKVLVIGGFRLTRWLLNDKSFLDTFTILSNISKDFRKSRTERQSASCSYLIELQNRPTINQTYPCSIWSSLVTIVQTLLVLTLQNPWKYTHGGVCFYWRHGPTTTLPVVFMKSAKIFRIFHSSSYVLSYIFFKVKDQPKLLWRWIQEPCHI